MEMLAMPVNPYVAAKKFNVRPDAIPDSLTTPEMKAEANRMLEEEAVQNHPQTRMAKLREKATVGKGGKVDIGRLDPIEDRKSTRLNSSH